MIVIVNTGADADAEGRSAYVVRVGEEIVCKFSHDRRHGLAECLRDAADAVESALRARDRKQAR